ncbi:hypothetical protein [Stenotrophomonas acidaminiphila]|uniref:hypothetical protein n=1 Tax=Stenotrophomonas acidaminiphila TaxID=128780 RepID=UPI0015FC80A1|nr:hypothetical protein [Stenotrophomonas acidaminiphila]
MDTHAGSKPLRRGAPRAYWPCALVALLWLPPPPALACGSLPADMQRRLVAGDLQRQQALAAMLATRADAIVIADVVAVAPDDARVHVRQWIKGAGDAALQVAPANRLDAIGCLPSAEFGNVALRPGEHYLLYLAGGSVLRAGNLRRGSRELTLGQELARVRGSMVAPATTEVR